MLRTALKPRWLALLAVVVLVVASFTWLGLWQLDVARDSARREAAEAAANAPVMPVAEVLAPHAPLTSDLLGRKVSATGTYVAEHQVILTPRANQGQPGVWVLTPLDVDGVALPVVRGWVADAAQVQPPPTGPVTVTAALAPPESAPDEPADLPPGQMSTIDLASLVNVWDTNTFSAVAFLISQTPTATTSLSVVAAPVGVESQIEWRNLAYAAQWWFFAAFAVYMWFRMVREDSQDSAAAVARNSAESALPTDSALPNASGGISHDSA